MSLHTIQVQVNGKRYERQVESRLLLVHFLRDVLGLTGTHIGCDTSQCGACTVHLDGEAVKSCTVLAVQADGARSRRSRASRRTVSSIRSRPRSGTARAAVRLLHAGHHHGGRGVPRPTSPDPTRRDPGGLWPATSAAAPATRTSSTRSRASQLPSTRQTADRGRAGLDGSGTRAASESSSRKGGRTDGGHCGSSARRSDAARTRG